MSDSPTSAPAEIPSPLLVAAWERLRLLATDRVPLWAAYWIAGGHDGPALVHLAGLHGDDPVEVHDALPGALADCGVGIPDSDVAAAAVAFTHVARLHVNGLVDQRWVLSQVSQIVIWSEDPVSVRELPLGRLYVLDGEWDASWGQARRELARVVREACEEELRNGPTA